MRSDLIQKGHNRHRHNTAESRKDIDLAGVDRVFVIKLSLDGHGRCARGHGGHQGDIDDRGASRDESGEIERFHDENDPCRQGDHSEEGDEIQALIPEQVTPLDVSEQHAHKDHGGGTVGVAEQIAGVHDDRWQIDVEDKQQQADRDRDEVDIPEKLFRIPLRLAADGRQTDGPQKELLNEQESAGIDKPFLPEYREHERKDQIAGVRVDQGGALDRRQAERPLHDCDSDCHNKVNYKRRSERQKKAVSHLRRVIDLECCDHDRRSAHIDVHDRDDAAVGRLQ